MVSLLVDLTRTSRSGNGHASLGRVDRDGDHNYASA
jgi:hypothetical protein